MALVLRSLLFAVLSTAASFGCAGGGDFGGLAGGQKKSDKQERRPDPAPQPAPADEDGGADQPVLVTGTYLTCGVVARATDESPSETFGCRLASKATGETVPLELLATRWTWNHTKTAGGTVTQQETTGAWQIVYRLEARDRVALAALRSTLRIILDLVLKPGAGSVGDAILSEFLENLLGSDEELGGVTNEDGAQDDGGAADGTAPGPTPTPTAGAGTTDGDADASGDDVGSDGSGDGETETVLPPIVSFSLAPGNNAELKLMAAVDDATGVSNLRISGNGSIVYLGADFSGGAASLKWRLPMEVSLRKNAKDCLGRGTIGSGTMSMTLACR